MKKQVNPFNVLAFYDADLDISLLGWLHCPTTRLMRFQTLVDGAVTKFELVAHPSGTAIEMSLALLSLFEADGKKWVTYFGGTLGTELAPGNYRVRLTTVTGQKYWSHMICATPIFGSSVSEGEFTLELTGCSNSGGGVFEHTWAVSDLPTIGSSIVFSDGISPPRFLPVSGSIVLDNENYGGVDDAVTVFFTISAIVASGNGGQVSISKTVEVSFLRSAPCDVTIIDGDPAISQGDEVSRLVFFNNADVQSQNLVYQAQSAQRYQQEFFFKGYREMPVAITEEEFERDATGRDRSLFVRVGEQIVFEFYPLPDYLLTVLANARAHDFIYIETGSYQTRLDAFAVENKAIGEAYLRAGIFRCDIFTTEATCRENFEAE